MVLNAAASPVMSSTAFARLLGFDVELTVVVLAVTTLLLPVTLAPIALGLLSRETAIDPTGYAVRVGLFLAKWLLLAFALESLMVAWIPADMVAGTLGGDGWTAVPLAVAVGVPAYLNGYAAIPLVGELLDMGMAPGAALAFLVAGGVTSLPASMAVFALVRRPVFLWYLALSLAGSLAVGFGYQAFLAL